MNEREKLYYEQGVSLPETPAVGDEPEPWGTTAIVGDGIPRVDGYERLSGAAIYPSDIIMPGMLYGALLRCPHPHARLKSIDVQAAEKSPGVRAVLHDGSPAAKRVEWSYGRGEEQPLFARECLFEGQPVAAVAADTPYEAEDALKALAAEWEVLPHVVTVDDAAAEGAPRVHADGNRIGEPRQNQRGDVEQGFAEADVVLEREYTTATELHTPMELHGAVAFWDGRNLTVHESTQGAFAVQEQLARALNLPLSRVRAIGHYMGGGFGSKLQTGTYAVVAALLAEITARPVKVFLNREDTMLDAGNRPASSMRLKAGVKNDGTLTALDFHCEGTGGAWAGGTGLCDWQVRDLYTCPNVRTESVDWYTHAGVQRPFRAPGHPQGSWALEQMIDELAEAIDMDPVELRLKNVPRVSQGRDGQPPYTTTGLAECLRDGAREFGWEEARRRTRRAREQEAGGDDADRGAHIRRGVGMAACEWIAGGGGPPAGAVVTMFSDGSVSLEMGAADIGTGTKTVMAQVVAEELGVRPETIRINNADTTTVPFSGPSGGSKTVPTDAPAVRNAAVKVKRQLMQLAADDLGVPVEELSFAGETIHVSGDPDRKVVVADMDGLRRKRSIEGVGHRGPNPEGKVVSPFAAQFCEVEVDTRSGEVRVLRFVGAHDSGRVMNRRTYESQVIGGITMGIGLGLTEARILDVGQSGKICNKSWHDYKLPTALDVPADIATVPIDLEDDESNITGAKGLGEPVTIPTAAAVANAIYDACGARPLHSPVWPLELVRLLQASTSSSRQQGTGPRKEG
ncbi:MAG: xanthine dehydrogenase family protein molybdopterin-binding subunit [Candidatus Krumholzibacteriia bacterium]